MAVIGELAALLTLNSTDFNANLGKAVASAKEAGTAIASSTSKINLNNLSNSLKNIGTPLTLLSGGVIAYTTTMAAHFQSMTQEIAGNTDMTTKQLNYMRQSILNLADQSGAPLNDLATGFMHIVNLGYQGADATNILTEAMKSAVATGSNVGDTANVLAQALRDFNLPASDATKIMNELHIAAAQGNMTLEQLMSTFGQAQSITANLNLPLDQTAAAMSALTRHGVDASEAGTQLKNMLLELAAPTQSSYNSLLALQKVTGVNLTYDFSAAGLKAKGLSGVLNDLKKATNGNIGEMLSMASGLQLTSTQLHTLQRIAGETGKNQIAALRAVDPNIRGMYGLYVLLNNGAKDYQNTLSTIDSQSAQNIVNSEYQAKLKTFSQQIDILKNNFNNLSIGIGNALIPMLVDLFQKISPIISIIRNWISAHTQLIAKILLVTVSVGLMLLTLSGVITVVSAIISIFNPLGLIILSIIAVITLLSAAWINNWGNIRKIVTDAMNIIIPYFTMLINIIKEVLTPIWENLTQIISKNKQAFMVLGGILVGVVVAAILIVATAITGVVIVFVTLIDVIANIIQFIFRFIEAFINLVVEIKSGKESIRQAFADLIGNIMSAFGSLLHFMFSLGRNIIGNLISGIKSNSGLLGNAIGGVAQVISDYLPHSPAKKGPLTKINEMMPSMLNIFENDLKNGLPKLAGTLNSGLAGISSASMKLMSSPTGFASTYSSSSNVTSQNNNYAINVASTASSSWQDGRVIQGLLENLASQAVHLG